MFNTPDELVVRLPQPVTCQRERCRHSWTPRVPDPKFCPRCKQPWRKPLKDFRTRIKPKTEPNNNGG